MGLFIKNPEVFRNKENLQEPNQQLLRRNSFSELMEEQQKANSELREFLKQTMLKTEGTVKQDLMNQINSVLDSNQEIIKKNDTIHQQFTLQLEEQLDLQKQMAIHISKQEEIQKSVLSRLDSHEAIIEKISRQLHEFRSILFERTNHLAEKIENGYKATSSYLHKLLTGSDQQMTFFLMKNKKEENKKQQE